MKPGRIALGAMAWMCGCAVSLAPAFGAERLCATPDDVAAAAKRAQPGDVILLRDGTWQDADLRFEANGTAERPITLRALTPGKVILTGKSRLRFAGEYLVVDGLRFEKCNSDLDVVEFRSKPDRPAQHCRLTNCELIDCSAAKRETNTRYVSLYGADNRMDHCYLAGKSNLGPTLVVWLKDQPARHRIDHNHFGPRPRLKLNGGETIRLGDSHMSAANARCVVEENLFEECDGEVEIISNKSCENIYRWNTFRRCEGALTLRIGHRCTVEGNFFLGEGRPFTGGIRVIGEDHRVFNNYLADLEGKDTRAAICLIDGIKDSPASGYYQVRRAMIAFNTLVNCQQSVVLGCVLHGATLPPEDCTFANNLIHATHAPLVTEITAPVRTAWLANAMSGADSGLKGQGADVITLDPKLSRAADGLWRPGNASPVLGAARGDFAFASTDMDGQPRPAAKDIGCDQVSTAPVVHRPLTAADVGPAWKRASQ